ncbi:VOC family protein [Pleionea litopenaei]|uniref:VOC family protein n=1 Tax=Pleionea litopenaei TaxID=3070815 RepID=A0AA51RR58_9GAMM|nr:VOC family protein [Pleionea sp. HL-JVS1]WMS86148.1 VOC family protein [Pleionea sp. HL-JVS1]
MLPELIGIDHLHIYVNDKALAEAWYQKVLGFKVVEHLSNRTTSTGPLTLSDTNNRINLAIFERENYSSITSIAFKTNGENFLLWKKRLEDFESLTRCVDHEVSFSLYFNDPFGHNHEITSYEHSYIREHV